MFDILMLAILIAVLTYYIFIRRPQDFPPGPIGVPIFGNLFQFGDAPFLRFQEWKDKYGPVIGVYFGSFRTVAISDYRLIKEALADSNLSGRPDMEIWHARSRDTQARGLMFTEGLENVEQRRMAMRSLKDFGTGRKAFENVVTSEIITMLENFEKFEGEPIKLKNRFHTHILNILWHIIAGQGCEEDRQLLAKIYSNSTKIVEENNGFKALFMFIPWFCKYFPSLSGYDGVNSQLGDIWRFLDKHIEEHKKELEDSPTTAHDFIGAYINEMRKTKDASSSFYKEVGEKNLRTTLLDLFFAGADTVSYTLQWTCLLLSLNPQVQGKFQEEIDQVIGASRLPEANDEGSMPYTQALIQEILRYTSVAPLAIFHNAMQDVQFHGYSLTKDTMVLINLYSSHHDKEYWGDPHNLRPERFLSPDAKTLVKHEAFFPFGLGKRVCVGEILARSELFLMIVSIFQKFRVLPDPANPNPSLKPIVSFLLMPPNHQVIFEKRNNQ